MSTISERKAFFRDIVTYGAKDLQLLTQLAPWRQQSSAQLARWWDKFQADSKEFELTNTPRLVNHWALGADPEFVFTETLAVRGLDGAKEVGEAMRVNAEDMKLKAGRAYGADNNGRLVEIRPAPSKWALDMLASMHTTMRWLCILHPKVRRLGWVAGAFKFKDGLGGHVHFGCKRKVAWPVQVEALDQVDILLEHMGVFPAAECAVRRGGDAHKQFYGQYGDYRKQKHGYEYRTFPSWIDSPWMAYLCLVLSKLAAYDPELFVHGAGKLPQPELIRNVLRYYSGLDDDAKLALRALKVHGFPRFIGGDFKTRWGLEGYPAVLKLHNEIKYVPSMIPAEPACIGELWRHFYTGAPIANGTVPAITWTPTKPPEGFTMLLDLVDTRVQKGLGELIYDLVVHIEDVKNTQVCGIRDGYCNFHIAPKSLVRRMLLPEKALAPLNGYDYPHGMIGIPLMFREGANAKETRKLLLDGAFPFWKITEATQAKRDAWGAGIVPKKVIGKLIAEEAV